MLAGGRERVRAFWQPAGEALPAGGGQEAARGARVVLTVFWRWGALMSYGRRDCNCLNEWEERQQSGGVSFVSLTGGGIDIPA